MQIGTKAQAPRGSFGIPPGMSPEEIAKKRAAAEKAAEAATPPPATDAGFKIDDSADEADDDEPKISDESRQALKDLEALGIELTSDDWNRIYFAGFLEKDLTLKVPDPESKSFKDFKITVRTPTAGQADLADELFAEELQSANFTREGAENRKSMWNFAFAVQKINGRELTKPVLGPDKKIDLKKSIKAKREVLSQMSPLVLKHASIKYTRFVELLDLLVKDPSEAFFSKP